MRNILLISLLFSAAASFTPPMHAQQQPVVSVVPVVVEKLSPTMDVIGQVQSRNQSNISAGIAGQLVWTAEPGDCVKSGEVVAQIDKRPYQLAVQQLHAKIQRAGVTIQRYRNDLARLEQLVATNAVSSHDVEQKESDLALAESEKALLQIELEQAQRELDKTDVRAPFTGVVANRMQTAGEDISPTTAIVRLVNPDDLEIKLHGPLFASAFLTEGQYLGVTRAQQDMRAQVDRVVPVSNAQSQTFTAYLTVANQPRLHEGTDMKLQIGEIVSVALPSALPEQTNIVPRDALIIREQGTHVYVLDTDDKAQKVNVEITGGQGNRVAVAGNLLAGQRVVVRGGEMLRSNQQVTVLTSQDFPVTTFSE